jgi:hypothetical protein
VSWLLVIKNDLFSQPENRIESRKTANRPPLNQQPLGGVADEVIVGREAADELLTTISEEVNEAAQMDGESEKDDNE